MGENILILGGGIGGVSCARAIRKALPQEHTVTLVDSSANHVYQPSLLWVAFGSRKAEGIARPLSRLDRHGIRFHRGAVTRIDVEGEAVETDTGVLRYDRLVIALGARLAPEKVPGLSEAAHIFYTSKGAEETHRAVSKFGGGKAVVLVSAMPYKCPAAPYETALLLDSHLRARGLRSKTTVQVVTFEPAPMPTAGPAVGMAVEQMLAGRNIDFLPGMTVEEVDGKERQIKLGAEAVDYDLLLAVPPHASPDAVAASAVAAPSGWIPVDARTLKTPAERVYAIGDVTAVGLKNGKMLPKAGVFAHAQGEVVARRIAAEVAGRAGESAFNGKGSCFLELGGGKAGFATGDFYAEPDPDVQLKSPGRLRHLEKVILEKQWLRQF